MGIHSHSYIPHSARTHRKQPELTHKSLEYYTQPVHFWPAAPVTQYPSCRPQSCCWKAFSPDSCPLTGMMARHPWIGSCEILLKIWGQHWSRLMMNSSCLPPSPATGPRCLGRASCDWCTYCDHNNPQGTDPEQQGKKERAIETSERQNMSIICGRCARKEYFITLGLQWKLLIHLPWCEWINKMITHTHTHTSTHRYTHNPTLFKRCHQ